MFGSGARPLDLAKWTTLNNVDINNEWYHENS